MTDLWIDAQNAETKHKWISAIRKAIKGEPIVETIQDKKNEIADDMAQIENLKKGSQSAAVKSQIAMLTEEINQDQNDIDGMDSDNICEMCGLCTVM